MRGPSVLVLLLSIATVVAMVAVLRRVVAMANDRQQATVSAGAGRTDSAGADSVNAVAAPNEGGCNGRGVERDGGGGGHLADADERLRRVKARVRAKLAQGEQGVKPGARGKGCPSTGQCPPPSCACASETLVWAQV